jgi:serine phosphatase RsbU (regulator of sigma subunit)
MVDLSRTAARFLAQPAPGSPQELHVDLHELIDHRHFVRGDDHLDQVQHRFAGIGAAYMAVLDEGRVVGLCSRHEIAQQLGSQYGFALFGRSPVRDHLVPNPLIIPDHQDWQILLRQVFARVGESFNDDVVLVDRNGELLGLVTVQSLIRLQTRLLMQAIEQLKRQRAEISRQNRKMTSEMAVARRVQRALQPQDLSSICSKLGSVGHSIRLAAHYEPKGLVSGDFFEVLAIGDSTLSLMIADVMGHGVQAALITSMLRALIQEHSPLAADPAALLAAVNQSLCAILADVQDPVFVSAFAAALHVPSGNLQYASAGHPSPLLLRPADRSARYLECSLSSNGGVLGIDGAWSYQESAVVMQSRDQLLVYTDGLFEVADADGAILGQEGLLEMVGASFRDSGEFMMNDLLGGIRRFSRDRSFTDDICLIALELC